MTEIIKNLSANSNLSGSAIWDNVPLDSVFANPPEPSRAAVDRNTQRMLRDARAQAIEAMRGLTQANKRIAELERLSRTDEATGLDNRRGFDIDLEAALSRARRIGEKGLLVLIDLDRFKAINDTYGHHAGDAVLKAVGEVLTRNTRDTDSVARIGGDEFAMILSDSKQLGAEAKVAMLEEELNATTVLWKNTRIAIRASFGSTPFGADDDPVVLYQLADMAMYDRKRRRAADNA